MKSLTPFLSLPALCIPMAALAQPPVTPASVCSAAPQPAAETLFSVPFKIVDGRIYVDAMVNGQGPFTFAVDTGASGWGRADASLTAKLGLQPFARGQTSDGISTATVDQVRFASLSIGGYSRSDLDVLTRNFSSRMEAEKAIAGIVGRDFFADGVLTIDYPATTLTFSKGATLSATDPAVLAYSRPFRIAVTVKGIAVEANLDTGANVEMVMPASLFDRVGDRPAQPAANATLTNTTIESSSSVVAGPLRLGAIELNDTPVRISDRIPEMMIGARLLQKFKIIIDQPSRLLAICPAP